MTERDETASETQDRLIWRVRRARENPGLCLLLIAFEAALGYAVNMYYTQAHAAFAVVFITLALLPFYGSYRYELSPEKIKIFGPLYHAEHDWNEFESWRTFEDDLRLTFKDKDSVLVLFAPRRLNDVVQYIQRHLPRMIEDS